MAADKWIKEPSRKFVERTNVYRFMKRLGLSNVQDFLRFTRDGPETFWSETLKEILIESIHRGKLCSVWRWQTYSCLRGDTNG